MVEDGLGGSIQSRQLTDLGLPLLNCRRLALCVAPGLGATIFSAKQHLKTRECEGLWDENSTGWYDEDVVV